jgi:hypothetical protein
MSAVEELEDVVQELGIKQTIKTLAVICSDCADEAKDDDEPEETVNAWEDVAEALDNIEIGDLD